jgi:hypothetical protein
MKRMVMGINNVYFMVLGEKRARRPGRGYAGNAAEKKFNAKAAKNAKKK